ncbi:MAG TPA: 5-deoxy-glucuronate isomerase [Candidatus Paceibacterota bacterium]|nr:5-deoxy-glucuronate isomerase [Verrucomicrobiota bacterium]HOX03077.1 5-deoxy-glucuronate isomerase [Verrucomicrobiota bacterium]HRZ45967.1 5-deoxy-glucuronate isomerase [Candidatus Paceibacterota bacterium]
MSAPKPATYVPADAAAFRYVEKSSPQTSHLQFLTCGWYELAGEAASGTLAHPAEEALLFCWQGQATARLGGARYPLQRYDVLYVPRGAAYQLAQDGGDSKIIICRAPAEKAHPAFHAKWDEFSRDERRIRHLKGKDVFLMFDVSESADKLIAGFTLFQPFQRSWPPHNHTDQEEIYIFTKGRGSMEVYAGEETKSFVRSVSSGDAVTIPILNYHPVFSQEEPLLAGPIGSESGLRNPFFTPPVSLKLYVTFWMPPTAPHFA